jgi:hypothetical protein
MARKRRIRGETRYSMYAPADVLIHKAHNKPFWNWKEMEI